MSKRTLANGASPDKASQRTMKASHWLALTFIVGLILGAVAVVAGSLGRNTTYLPVGFGLIAASLIVFKLAAHVSENE